MKQTVLRKWYIYFPVWLAIYTLPLPALVLLVIWGLSQSQPDLLRFIAAFPGTFLFGALLLFPLFSIYFAVIALMHALIDEIFFCKTHKIQRCVICVLSTASSAILIIASICVYWFLFSEIQWLYLIPIILMLLGDLTVITLLGSRLILDFVPHWLQKPIRG